MNLWRNLTRFDKPIQSNPVLWQASLLAMAARTSRSQAVLCYLVSALPMPASCISTHIVHVVHLFGFKLFQDVPSRLAIGAKVDRLHNYAYIASHFTSLCCASIGTGVESFKSLNQISLSLPSPSELTGKQIQTRPRKEAMICYD